MKSYLPLLILLVVIPAKCNRICCPLIGCVDEGFLLGIPLPLCTIEFDVTFALYTRSNPASSQPITQQSIPAVFNRTRQTVFIIHGYLSLVDKSWMVPLKDELLVKDDLNVILTNWGQSSILFSYQEAAHNTPEVGKRTADVIQNIVANKNVNASTIWCIGHGLGAHACGYAGLRLPRESPLGRITGLDPAGPLFEDKPDRTVGLNSSCAHTVDVIHTELVVYGTKRNLGHMDFYLDGFKYAANTTTQIICDDVCRHRRAIDVMRISVNNNCFITDKHCTSYSSLPDSCTTDVNCLAYVGYQAIDSCHTTDILYLLATPNSPFCPA